MLGATSWCAFFPLVDCVVFLYFFCLLLKMGARVWKEEHALCTVRSTFGNIQ